MSELQFNPEPYNLKFGDKKKLATALLECSHIKHSFQKVILQLPDHLHVQCDPTGTTIANVLDLIDVCLKFPNGFRDLHEVIEAYDDGSFGYQNVVNSLIELKIAKVPEQVSIEQIKNHPEFLSENTEFHQKVKYWLEYEDFIPQKDSEQFVNYYVANKNVSGHVEFYGILTFYNPDQAIFDDFLTGAGDFLKSQLEATQDCIDKVRFVTYKPVDKAVISALNAKLGARKIQFVTFADILSNPLGMGGFLQYWEKKFFETDEEHPDFILSEVYIEQRAEKWMTLEEKDLRNIYDKELRARMRELHYSGDKYRAEPLRETLETYVESWLKEPNRKPILLVGNYGTGKSTFCRKLAAQVSSRRLESDERIPILIELARLNEGLPTTSALALIIKNIGELSAPPDVQKLEKLAKDGKVLFLLDGFDELKAQADSEMLERNVKFIERLVKDYPKSKLILTTRPEYFESRAEQRDYLGGYEELHLQLFEQEQIKNYLRLRLGSEEKAAQAWDDIESIQDLPDMAHRAVFLEMIVVTLSGLLRDYKRSEITRPLLYRHYLLGELRRQREKRDRDPNARAIRISDDNVRLRIMELIALKIYHEKRSGKGNGLTANEIEELFKDTVLLNRKEAGKREGILRDIRGCSFLVCPQDRYFFSHTSFYEYLLSVELFVALQNNDNTHFVHDLLSPLTLEFLAEMLTEDSSELQMAKKWLDESTQKAGGDGQVPFGIFEQNLAGLLLARRVVGLSQQEITGYITCAEYQLFLEDTKEKFEGDTSYKAYRQPAHWQSYTFPSGMALEPLGGVQYDAASYFCTWLTWKHGGSFKYELLNRKKLLSPDFHEQYDLATWVDFSPEEEVDFFAIQLNSENAQKIRQKLLDALQISHLNLSCVLEQAFAFGVSMYFSNNSVQSRAFALALDRAYLFNIGAVYDNIFDRDFKYVNSEDNRFNDNLVSFIHLTRNYYASNTFTDCALSLALSLVQDPSIVYVPEAAAVIKQARSRAVAHDLNEIADLIKQMRYEEAREMAITISCNDEDVYKQRSATLISDLLSILLASNFAVLTTAHREYICHYVDILLEGYTLLELEKNAPEKYAKAKEILKNLKLWTKMIEARIEGKLPAWEGIRFTRQRKEKQ